MWGGVHVPTTIISCINGILRDGENNILSQAAAIMLLSKIEQCVIKKTIATNSGRDVEIVCPSEIDIGQKLISFGKNYVVQELIEQSSPLKALNPTSVNTFRVITYLCNDEVCVSPVALRIGRSNADRDNIHYGGICVGVTQEGLLRKQAFSEYGESFTAHPDTGVKFDAYRIEGAGARLRETAQKLHCYLPYLGIISWDLTIDSNGAVTLIEMNTTGQSAWFCQMVNGEALFGENTGYMLESIRKK